MTIQDYASYDKKAFNHNIIRRHINEVKQLRNSNTKDIEQEYAALRTKHTSESNTLHYYRNLYKKNIINKTNTLHGHFKLHDIKLCCNDQEINGSIFVLSPEADFLKIKNSNVINLDKYINTKYFYHHLKDIPLPFIFLPSCDMHEYRKFNDQLNVISELRMGFYLSKNEEYTIMLAEPFILTTIDLDYLIEEFINDHEICCFLYGFLVNKAL